MTYKPPIPPALADVASVLNNATADNGSVGDGVALTSAGGPHFAPLDPKAGTVFYCAITEQTWVYEQDGWMLDGAPVRGRQGGAAHYDGAGEANGANEAEGVMTAHLWMFLAVIIACLIGLSMPVTMVRLTDTTFAVATHLGTKVCDTKTNSCRAPNK